MGKRAASGSQCSDTGEKPAKQQKKGKVWDQPNEVNKVIKSLISKVDKVRELADGVVEESESFGKLSDEEKAVIKRNLDVLKQRMPLLNCWLGAASGSVLPEEFPQELADQWRLPEPRAASWKETFAACKQATTSIKSEGEHAADKWPEMLGTVVSALKSTVPFSSTDHPDHDLCAEFLQRTMNTEGKPVSEVSIFLEDIAQLYQTTVSRTQWTLLVKTFIENKATLPVENLSEIRTLMMLKNVVGALKAVGSEDALKTMDTDVKNTIEKTRDFVQSIKATVKAATAAFKTYQTEQVKKAKSIDKDRDMEEKKKLAQAKKEMQDIKLMCKDKVSPGLLSYCGPMMLQVPKFADIDAFKAGVAQIDTTTPYLIESCSSLTSLVAEPVVNTAFLNFRAQLPRSESAKQKKKAQCPLTVPTTSEKIRSAMLELGPSSRIPFIANMSMWGCQQDMLQGGFEFQCLGNLRFTSRGTREIAAAKFTDLFAVMKLLAAEKGKPMPNYSNQNTIADHVERALLHEMTTEGLKFAVDGGMKAFRFTAGPGSMVFVPAGWVTVERAIGVEGCTGVRMCIIEDANVLSAVSPVEAILSSYSGAESAVLKAFADVRAAMGAAGKACPAPAPAAPAGAAPASSTSKGLAVVTAEVKKELDQ